MQRGCIVYYVVHPSDEEHIKSNNAKILPAIVVHAFSETYVNLKVFTDGPQDGWKTSVQVGLEPGQCYVP